MLLWRSSELLVPPADPCELLIRTHCEGQTVDSSSLLAGDVEGMFAGELGVAGEVVGLSFARRTE